jgi:hypothetical protein
MKLESANLHQHGATSVAGNFHKSWGYNDLAIKNGIAYTTVVLLVNAAIAYLYVCLPPHYSTTGTRYFFAILYFLTGMAHVFTFPKWFPQLYDLKGFFCTLLLAVTNAVLIFTIFMLLPFDNSQFPFVAASAFLLPAAIKICWQYFSVILAPGQKPWSIPAGMQPETRMSLLLNSLFFRVNIRAKAQDAEPTLFNVTLSHKLTLGAMFCRFLHDQQGRVEGTGGNGSPCAWKFYVKNWLGTRPLNPEISLLKNGIEEGDVIWIERIVQ